MNYKKRIKIFIPITAKNTVFIISSEYICVAINTHSLCTILLKYFKVKSSCFEVLAQKERFSCY